MANSIAVLLIIGSAVIGPIEGKQIGTTFYKDPHAAELLGCALPGKSIDDLVPGECHRESLPELCERAMREIGIDTKMQSGFVSYGWREQNGKFLYAFGAWSPSKSSGDDWPVRCIPVPEGYRR